MFSTRPDDGGDGGSSSGGRFAGRGAASRASSSNLRIDTNTTRGDHENEAEVEVSSAEDEEMDPGGLTPDEDASSPDSDMTFF